MRAATRAPGSPQVQVAGGRCELLGMTSRRITIDVLTIVTTEWNDEIRAGLLELVW